MKAFQVPTIYTYITLFLHIIHEIVMYCLKAIRLKKKILENRPNENKDFCMKLFYRQIDWLIYKREQ